MGPHFQINVYAWCGQHGLVLHARWYRAGEIDEIDIRGRFSRQISARIAPELDVHMQGRDLEDENSEHWRASIAFESRREKTVSVKSQGDSRTRCLSNFDYKTYRETSPSHRPSRNVQTQAFGRGAEKQVGKVKIGI